MQDKEVRKLAAVMFTDIEGYSAMVQKNEKEALKKVSAHRQFLEEYTAQFNGKVVQFYGDGSLSIYDSAVDTVYCAIDISLQKGEKFLLWETFMHDPDLLSLKDGPAYKKLIGK